MINFFRLPFILLALISLLFGLWTGLNRIGWNFGTFPVNMHHGAIMVGGFLGTLISLEKIIPLKNKLLFLIPALSASAVPLFLLNVPSVSFLALILAAAGLFLVFTFYFTRNKSLVYILMMAGSICWLTGNALLLSTHFYPLAFPWWAGFALLIITAERLELMKLLPVTNAARFLLVTLLALYIGGVMLSFHGPGYKISGASLIAISLWLMRYDMAGISIRKKGLPKFTAISLLAGYIAMLLAGVFLFALEDQSMSYDVLVHTFFLGFVFSMIFAHGPIILPGVLGTSERPYHPVLYVWLFLLHASWIMRIASDILLDFHPRMISALITALTIPAYFVTIATLTITRHRQHAKVL